MFMEREAKDCLEEIAHAIDSIRAFTASKDLNDYLSDELLRAAVERKFGILGAALSELLRDFPLYSDRITPVGELYAIGRRMTQGDSDLQDAVVWEMIHVFLPRLRRQVQQLLEGPRPEDRVN